MHSTGNRQSCPWPILLLAGLLLSLSAAASEAPRPVTAAVSPPAQRAFLPYQVAKVAAGDPRSNDFFGAAVAADGDTLVVGAFSEDGGTGDPLWNAGAVYVFERNQGGNDAWGQVAKLTAGDPGFGDYFGASVAISGDTIAVGAPYENAGSANIPDAGAVYLFERHQGGPNSWGQVKKVIAGDPDEEDDFGLQLDLDADTLVVGASGEDGGPGNPMSYAGAIYILERNQGGPGNWGEVKKLWASDVEEGDGLGSTVAIDGDRLVAGAASEDGGAGNPVVWAGAAYIFERDLGGANNWGEVKKLSASDAGNNDRFGTTATIQGDTIIVGAPFERGGPGDPYFVAGAAYVFERDQGGPGNWGEVKKLVASDPGEGDFFAASLDLVGDILVSGAAGEDGGPGNPLSDSGAVYVLERNSGGDNNWGELVKLAAEDASASDRFGTGVSMSNSGLIFIGAAIGDADGPPQVNDSGAAYIFALSEPEPNVEYLLYVPAASVPATIDD